MHETYLRPKSLRLSRSKYGVIRLNGTLSAFRPSLPGLDLHCFRDFDVYLLLLGPSKELLKLRTLNCIQARFSEIPYMIAGTAVSCLGVPFSDGAV